MSRDGGKRRWGMACGAGKEAEGEQRCVGSSGEREVGRGGKRRAVAGERWRGAGLSGVVLSSMMAQGLFL